MIRKESEKVKDKKNSIIWILAILAIIIIIILVIILFIHFLLNMGNPGADAFSGGVFCKAIPEYTCKAQFYYLNGTLDLSKIVIALGQNSGTTWTGANFILVNNDTALTNGIPNIGGSAFSVWPANTVLATTSISSGENVIVYLPIDGTVYLDKSIALNSTIWAAYTTVPGGTVKYVQVGSVEITSN